MWSRDPTEPLRKLAEELTAKAEASKAQFTGYFAGWRWRSIETAPQNGTPILVYAENTGWEFFVVKWIETAWYTLDSDYNPFAPGLRQPSHWMPLPAPPKVAECLEVPLNPDNSA